MGGTTGSHYTIEAYNNVFDWQTTALYSNIGGNGIPNAIAASQIGFGSGTFTVTIPGDANLDGRVDLNDLTIVLSNYGCISARRGAPVTSSATAESTSTT